MPSIRKGEGGWATSLIKEMAKTPAGTEELRRIHELASKLIAHAKSAEAANILKTLQDIAGTLGGGL